MALVKNMPTPNQIKDQINRVVGYLIEVGIADEQDAAFQRAGHYGSMEITFPRANRVSMALKDYPYEKIYQRLIEERAYNVKLLDGAIIQMSYEFAEETLQRHRLAFFPSPFLEEFQNNPDIYLCDEIYADVVAKNIVSFPVRFDYNALDEVHQKLVHPKCHLTLGQYERCRIPVTSPLMPFRFFDFILRNFYHVAFSLHSDNFPVFNGSFPESIVSSERNVIHAVIP